MKQHYYSFLLTMLLCMTGATAFAHNIAVANDDGVTIYYVWTNDNKELGVSYRGNSYSSYSNEYSGVVVIPSSVTYNGSTYSVTCIGGSAFYGCSGLTSVTIPNSVTSIGESAFNNCTGLTSVTIPNSVTSIDYRAFYQCSGLTSISIGKGLTSIGSSAFYGTGWYNDQPDGILYLDNWLIGVKGEKPTGKLVIDEGTRGLAYGAFSGSSGLTSVTIPNSMTSMGDYAFYNCSSLTSVTIPNSVTSIGGYAFYNCSGLTSVTIGNSVTSIGDYAFFSCSSLTSVTIGNSVTSLGESVFSGCSCLTSITIPDSMTSIGGFAFRDCSSLTSFTIPNSVTSLKCGTFYGCSSLTTITIPNSVLSIEDGYTSYSNFSAWGVFEKCSGLTSITIPGSVTSIGDFAFCDCSSLTSVTIPNSVTSIGRGAFSGCNRINSIYISDLSAWCNLFNSNTSAPFISCNHHLYVNGVEIERLSIPNSITNIGNHAFSGCSYITSITIPNSVTTIGESAFEKCSKVEELKLPDNLQIIKKATFKGCNSLKSVTIPSTVEVIYQEAFAGNTKMESVKAHPETPPFLYDNSFSNYNIPLYASKTAIAAYQTKEPWSKFAQFLTLDGQEVEVPQCATPTIDYANWKLTFNCATKGAEIVSKAKVLDEKDGGSELSLTPTYTITAYAKAEGYRDSEVATATIGWKNGRPVIIRGFSNVSLSDYDPNCDTNLDGTIDVADIATIIDAMAAQAREQVDLEE